MRPSERHQVLFELATACQSLANRPCFHCALTQTTFLGHVKGVAYHFSNFEGLFTFSNSLYLKTLDLFNENNHRNSTFDLSNINLLNKIFFVAQDAMDTKGFGTPIEMPMSLMFHPSTNK